MLHVCRNVLKGSDVVAYGDTDKKDEFVPLKKSVKAQVHSLEARGRQLISIRSDDKRLNGFHKQAPVRSRSENPLNRTRGGFTYLPTKGKSINHQILWSNASLHFYYCFIAEGATTPPPMPEKTKIHLRPTGQPQSLIHSSERPSSSRSQNTSSRTSMVNQPIIPPLTNSNGSRSRKVKDVKAQSKAKVDHRRQTKPISTSSPVSRRTTSRRPDQPLPEIPNNSKQSSLLSNKSANNNYEVLRSSSPMNRDRRQKMDSRMGRMRDPDARQDYRRSRSMGPIVTDQPLESPRSRARSRVTGERPAQERRSRSRGRRENEMFGDHERDLRKHKGKPVARTKSIDRGGLMQPPSPVEAQATIDEYLPRYPQSRMPIRQKSMIDLRDSVPIWDQNRNRSKMMQGFNSPHRLHSPIGGGLHNHRHIVPPNRQKPVMMRSSTEHDIKLSRNRRSMAVGPFEDLPPHIRQHMVRQHGIQMRHEEEKIRQVNLEAQREFLIRRGFPPNHPYISGEVRIHPELQGQLPFSNPSSRTIPLRPEDYHRFHPELWLHSHNVHPNPVPFNDVAVLHNEMEVRKRQQTQLQRRESQRNNQTSGMDFPGIENNFSSLPWEEILPKRMEHLHHQALQSVRETEERRRSRSRSQEGRRRQMTPQSPLDDEISGAWFNSGAKKDNKKKQKGVDDQWLLKEKSFHDIQLHHNPPQSMPPNLGIGSLRDSGIGEDNGGINLSRSDTDRSSFGMILKDKFQKNPNMYFPGDDESSIGNDPRQKSRSSSSPGSNLGRRSNVGRQSNASKNTYTTSIRDEEMEDQVAQIDLSDTDTLIHNMSDGSYEKDRLSLESGSGGHNSIGKESGKESRVSSGNSSLSPHNSMEGSPRMMKKDVKSQFKPNNSSVSGSKKTIRNYTPKESSNMLRELEDRRKKSSGEIKGKTKNTKLERKTSVERMIDDFHRNLPTPPPDPREQEAAKNRPSNQPQPMSSKPHGSKHGTMSSQVSNWSVASSSAASFDYQPGTNGKKKASSQDNLLPALAEVDYVSSAEPKGERVPPEGAPAASELKQSASFVRRIEVSPDSKSKKPVKSNNPAKTSLPKSRVLEEVQDMMMQSFDDPADDFSNLRKLISEGRIAGLNDKPPSFTPPTPPSTTKQVSPLPSTSSDAPSSIPSDPIETSPHQSRLVA